MVLSNAVLLNTRKLKLINAINLCSRAGSASYTHLAQYSSEVIASLRVEYSIKLPHSTVMRAYLRETQVFFRLSRPSVLSARAKFFMKY